MDKNDRTPVANSLFKNPPGEGTGPTRDGVLPVILVGRVPSRGVLRILQQAAKRTAAQLDSLAAGTQHLATMNELK